jgi:uncharacterized integral membrane protein
MILVYLLVAMLGAAAAFFALQNTELVPLIFFHWRSAGLPLSLLMLLSALAGVLLAALSGVAQQLQLHRRIRYLERRLTDVSDAQPSAAHVEAAPERMPERMRI